MSKGRFALLVAVSDYDGSGLSELQGTEADLEALGDALKSEDVGAFEEVVPLANPTRTEFLDYLRNLFDNRAPDDLALLYFSGHGIVDSRNRFFFAEILSINLAKGLAKASTP